ncbi:MAG: hypothetical protein AB4058_14150 [Microcystaceae cyanobacterium]
MIEDLEIKQRITARLEQLTTEELRLIDNLLINLNSYFEDQKTLDNLANPEDNQQEFVKSLQGKYAHAATSSDDFARRKQEEIDWEERNQ